MQTGKPNDDIKGDITKLGLEFGLMTQYTSFVAVEEKVVTEGGKPKTIEVPVEMPDGVSYEGIFSESETLGLGKQMSQLQAMGYAGAPITASAPRWPSLTGTPTNKPRIPYSPSHRTAQGKIFFWSLRMASIMSTTAAEGE